MQTQLVMWTCRVTLSGVVAALAWGLIRYVSISTQCIRMLFITCGAACASVAADAFPAPSPWQEVQVSSQPNNLSQLDVGKVGSCEGCTSKAGTGSGRAVHAGSMPVRILDD